MTAMSWSRKAIGAVRWFFAILSDGTGHALQTNMTDEKQLKIDALTLRAIRAIRTAYQTAEKQLEALYARLPEPSAKHVAAIGDVTGKRYEEAILGLTDSVDTYDSASQAIALMLAVRDSEGEILRAPPAAATIEPLADLIRACRG